MHLIFSTFRKEDFSEYLSWYADAELNLHLGPMKENDGWLHAVLHETDGKHYSVFDDGQLLAVVGIIFPAPKHPEYFITDFAVNPSHRSKGFGSAILHQLIRMHPLKKGQMWKAVVDVKNPKAKTFFEKNEWQSSGRSDEYGMFTLTLAARSS
jgi:GNAT superfamily N-acetyltransferase